MNDQLILKFPSHQAYKKEDFYVSPSNQKAYDFINSWPKWIKRTINIFGPSGSGKSHLASILKSNTSCLQIETKNLSDEIFLSKFSIIKVSFVLYLIKIFSFSSLELICKQDVLFFKIETKCDLPEPEGPKILTILFIHRGQLFIKS